MHPNFQLVNSIHQFYSSNLVWLLLWKAKQLAEAKHGLTLDIYFRVFNIIASRVMCLKLLMLFRTKLGVTNRNSIETSCFLTHLVSFLLNEF
jgi:hypothetical protein